MTAFRSRRRTTALAVVLGALALTITATSVAATPSAPAALSFADGPAVLVTGSADAEAGVGYELDVDVTAFDPGQIETWTVSWGDGVVDSGDGSPPTTLGHTYDQVGGLHPILVSVTTTDGAVHSSSALVVAEYDRSGPPSTSGLDDPEPLAGSQNGAADDAYVRALAATGDGRVVFVDDTTGRLFHVDPRNPAAPATPVGGSDVGRVTDMVVRATGDLVVATADGGVVSVAEGAGTVAPDSLVAEGHLTAASALFIGPDGDLFVADAADDDIERFDLETGEHLGRHAQFVPGAAPSAIEWGVDGSMVVALEGLGQVVRIDENGTTVIAADLGAPADLSLAPDGALWIIDRWNDAVRRVDATTGEELPAPPMADALAGPSALAFTTDLRVAVRAPEAAAASPAPAPSDETEDSPDAQEWAEALPEQEESGTIAFVANEGDADPDLDYAARADDYVAVIADDGVELVLSPETADEVVTMTLAESSPAEPSAASTESRVEFPEVYDGIDAVYEDDEGDLEYSFLIEPGADPGDITLDFDGDHTLRITASGDLLIDAVDGPDLISTAPYTYQLVNGERVTVSSAYRLRADGTIGFELGAYDPSRTVVIDPTLTPATNLVMVTADGTLADARDSERSAFFTALGYTVSVIGGNDAQLTFDNAAAANDVMVITASAGGTAAGTRARGLDIGVLAESVGAFADLMYSGSVTFDSTSPVTSLDVIDNTHYITSAFGLGSTTFFSPGQADLTWDSAGLALPSGAQVLVQRAPDAESLIVVETGAALYSANTATNRRAFIPSYDTTTASWTSNLETLVERAAAWGTDQEHNGNLLLVTSDGLLTGRNGDLEAKFLGYGWSVTVIDDDSGSLATTAAASDVVYLALGTSTAAADTLRVRSTGVVVEEADSIGRFMYSSDGRDGTSSITQLDVLDDSHPITAPLGTGNTTLFSSGQSVASWSAAVPAGVDTLAAHTFGGSQRVLMATESGATLFSANTAADRRVLFPIDATAPSSWNAAMDGVVERALAWASAGAPAGGGGGGSGTDLLMVTGNGGFTGGNDAAKRTLFESWGWTVTAIDDGSTVSAFVAAAAASDVLFLSDTANGSAATTVRDLDIGVVSESFAGWATLLHSGSGDQDFANGTAVDIVDNTHYITSPFSTGSLTIHTSADDVNYWDAGANALPTGVTSLADSPTSTNHVALHVTDAGGALYSANTAVNRRVWFPSDTASPSVFTTDYETLLERSLDWAAGNDTTCTDDSDSDGLLDCAEDANADTDDDPSTNPGPNTDGDPTPNYLDADDDGDGIPTASENADPNGDGDPRDALDTDRDGEPDYLDAPTLAATGTVVTEQKISATVGGFVGPLDNGDTWGSGVGPIGDLDGDGIVDLAVGAATDDDGGPSRGAVYVLFMNADGTVRTEQKISDTTGGLVTVLDDADFFGEWVRGIGDLDGDGRNEIVVGARYDDDGGTDRGAVYVLFLNADGTVKAEQKISDATGGLSATLADFDGFGVAADGIGDVDGDGIPDLAVGVDGDDDGGTDRGAVYVLFLNADGTVRAEQKISQSAGGGPALDDVDRFGEAVTGLGDVDGDGTPDLAVGSYGDDDGGSDRGAVRILFLNANGTVRTDQKISDTAGGLTATLSNNDWFGGSVGAIGDVDADGVNDVAVGAPGASAGGTERGAAHVLFLNADGTVRAEQEITAGSGGFTGTLDNGDWFGVAVSGIGDLDGDGQINLAVGAMYDDDGGADRGALHVLDLAPSGCTTDSDGDGLCDLEEDANTDADNDPATNPGPDTDGDTTPNHLDADDDGDGTPTTSENADPNADGDPRDALDTDLDGQPDYLDPDAAGASTTPIADEQKISALAGGLTATLDADDNLGRSVASIGDLDGDGVTDVAVGAARDDDGGSDRGAVHVLFLNSDGTVKGEQKISQTQGGLSATLIDTGYFGWSVESLGDLDGDGLGDIAVGARTDVGGSVNEGAVFVLFLDADGTVKAEQKISSVDGGLTATIDSGDNFGSGLAGLGDLNGDGVNDLVVGANGDDDGVTGAGAVHVLLLNSDGTVKAEQKISATAGGLSATLDASDFFGWSVAAIGDVDGDGVTDVAVGTRYDDDGGSNRGAVHVLMLNNDGTVKAEQKISDTTGGFSATLGDDDHFGSAVTGLGDLDGDGRPDLLVGAFGDDDGGSGQGAVYLLSLGGAGTVQSESKISAISGGLTGPLGSGDSFGASVASLGDLDDDGQLDIAVGAFSDNDGAGNAGAIYVLDLSPANGVTVNATGDAADAVAGDGLCDTGGTNSAGDPECTLRAAIEEANASATVDTIRFDMPATEAGHSAGVWTITTGSSLPAITAAVTIDGSTQAGYVANTNAAPLGLNGTQVVEISAGSASYEIFDVSGGAGTVINGLVINSGTRALFGFGVTITASYLGTDASGTAAKPGNNVVLNISNSQVGGTDPADRNLISGHGQSVLANFGNVFEGNIFGLDASASTALGQQTRNLLLRSSSNRIGGVVAGSANVISGDGTGVVVDGGTGNTILGNVITGNTVSIGDPSYNGIGIDLAPAANTPDGVTANDAGDPDSGPNEGLNHPVLTAPAVAATTMDIDLDVPAGDYRIEVFVNPSGADPTGNGEGETFTHAETVTHTGSGVESFTLTGMPSVAAAAVLTSTATEDLSGGNYGSTSEFSAAVTVVGDPAIVTVNSTGDGADALPGDDLCDTGGTNSEGDPECTLRAAIEEANASAVVDTIEFAIPNSDPNHLYHQDDAVADSLGAAVATTLADASITDFDPDYPVAPFSWWNIATSGGLPSITSAVTIDGTTQPGWQPNTATGGAARDVVLPIVVTGDAFSIFDLQGSGSTIRGINASGGNSSATVVILGGTGGHTFEGSWAQVGPLGVTNSALGDDGIYVAPGADGNQIGGPDPSDHVLVGNGFSNTGVDVGSDGNTLQNLWIGAQVTGDALLPGYNDIPFVIDGNDNVVGTPGAGIVVSSSLNDILIVGGDRNTVRGSIFGALPDGTPSDIESSSINGNDNMVGGVGPGDGNSFRGSGPNWGGQVLVSGSGNSLLGNDYQQTSELIIDVGPPSGPNPNDAGDGDVGANDLLNHPVVTLVVPSGATATVDYELDVPAGNYRIEFYADTTEPRNPEGYGAGEVLVGSDSISHTGSGVESFSATITDAGDYWLAATATEDLGAGDYGSTSEFGPTQCVGDTDADGLCDGWESVYGDSDGDTTANELDSDDDNDGTPTLSENADPNGDGNPQDARDSDKDGQPDWIDEPAGFSGPVVADVQKISSASGGLTGPLNDGDSFGSAMTAIGDLDGDGVVDVVVGADQDDTGGAGNGAVWVLLLNADGTIKAEQKIASGTGGLQHTFGGNERFGSGIASIGDLDSDGRNELAVGATGDLGDGGTSFTGAVQVLFLNADGTVRDEVRIASGAAGFTATIDDGDSFGSGVAGIGDVDGDGIPDMAVGAIGDDDGGSARGAVYVLFMNADGTVRAEQKISQTSGGLSATIGDSDFLGGALAGIGDVDGNGVPDLAVGAQGDDEGASSGGAVYILLLDTDGTLVGDHVINASSGDLRNPPDDSFELLGLGVAGVGDLDGDGVADLAVGAPEDEFGGIDHGSVRLLFLRPDGTVKRDSTIGEASPVLGATLPTDTSFGSAVAAIGDLDGDGPIGLLVGANNDDDGGSNRGAAYVLDLSVDTCSIDSDSDGLWDCEEDLDPDFDGDPSTNPGPNTDGDANPNYLDPDDDGDGSPTVSEDADPNGDGDPRDALDTDRDGEPDWLDTPTDRTLPWVATRQLVSPVAGGLLATLDDGDGFGQGATAIGDLDGDGVVDLAVGAPEDDDGGVDRGAVHLLFLNADGTVRTERKISSTVGGLIGPLDNNDEFGFGVGALGDIDGDGVPDIIVSAPFDGDGVGGALYVLRLNSDGSIKGEQKISDTVGGLAARTEGGRFGWDVSGIGDLDGDGIPDAAVGAPREDAPAFDEGVITILFLNADGTVRAEQRISDTEGGLSHTFLGDEEFGTSVAALGDVDGDGLTDLAVGSARTYDAGLNMWGGIHVLFMNADGTVKAEQLLSSGIGGLPSFPFDGMFFGESVEGVGDLDGDGTPDLAASAIFEGSGGTVHLITLNADGTAKAHRRLADDELAGVGGGDQVGSSLSAVGDLDGDGTIGLVVGAANDDDGGTDRGSIRVLDLAPCTDPDGDGLCSFFEDANTDDDQDPSTTPGPDTDGNLTPDYLDADDDGDGRPTLTETADPNGDNDPRDAADTDRDGQPDHLDVEAAPSETPIADEQKISDLLGGFAAPLDDNDRFGTATAAIGDIDADGVTDLAVGSPTDDDGGVDRGAVHILFMDTDGTVRAEQKISDTVGGLTAALDDADHFGHSVAGIGDLDGDGIGDLAVGAIFDDDGGSARGAVHVLFLRSDGTVRAEQKISTTAGGLATVLDDADLFGSSVAGIGDVDGDGIPDIAVGAWDDDDGGTDRGAVHILFLHPDGTVRTHQTISDASGGLAAALDDGDNFGAAVGGPGDLDGDGVPDLVVGAPADDDGATDAGGVYVLFLNADGTVSAEQKISATSGSLAASLDATDQLGASVAGVGDVNGDGIGDLLVGAPFDDDGGSGQGAAYLLAIAADGTVVDEWKISASEGGLTGPLDGFDEFGTGVAGLGDLDGDGQLNLVIGSVEDDDGGPNRGAVYVVDLSPPSVAAVNSTEDGADANPGDDVCSTGGTNTAGAPECTLRAAIEEANASPNIVSIGFSIPATEVGHDAGTWTIVARATLPVVTSSITIDGTTQPGWVDDPVIGVRDGFGADGLHLQGANSVVRELSVTGFVDGIVVDADAITVLDSWLGIEPNGTLTDNSGDGVDVTVNGTNAVIGAPGSGNVFSGDTGIEIEADDVTVQANDIGFGPGGTAGNLDVGIRVVGAANRVRIGGPVAGEGNRISNADENGDDVGVAVEDSAVDDVTLLGNLIWDNRINIDLALDGPTANDPLDGDTGPNGLLNHPTVTVTNAGAGTVDVDVTLDAPAGNYRIELFDNSMFATGGLGAAEELVHAATVTHPGGGPQVFAISYSDVAPDLRLSATATEDLGGGSYGSTSELSPLRTAPPVLTVNSTDDASDSDLTDGVCDTGAINSQGAPACTLRAAIEEANLQPGATIEFNLPTTESGYDNTDTFWTIAMGPNLPDLDADGLVIDGGSQPGYDSSRPLILLLDDGAGSDVFEIEGRDQTVRALAIGNPGDDAIQVESVRTTIDSMWLGVDPVGNSVGGSGTGSEGIIVYDGTDDLLITGVRVSDFDSGIISNSGTVDATITDSEIFGNRNGGIVLNTSGRFSSVGNSIHDNIGLGIDLGTSGVTVNDAGDGDAGGNGLLNHPVITAVTMGPGTLDVAFDLDVPAGAYRVEFFTNSTLDPSGHGEGETLVATAAIAHPGGGVVGFVDTIPGVAADVVTMTVTEDLGGSWGGTSEFSAWWAVDAQVVNSTDVAYDATPGDGVCDTGATNSAGAPECTLNAAIGEHNAAGGTSILFAIPATESGHAAGTWTIGATDTGSTPPVTDAVVLDATTQEGFVDAPVVELDGSAVTVGQDGLQLAAGSGGSVIRGLAVTGFGSGDAIDVTSSNNTIAGNWIGLSSDGTTVSPVAGAGVYIGGGTGTVVGGTTAQDRNVIAGGSNGVIVDAAGATVLGNWIGTDATGLAAGAITFDGVRFQNGASGAIGGATADAGNVIAGVSEDAVQIDDETTDGVLVGHNLIGIAADGETALGVGGDGVFVAGGPDSIVIADNVIGNTGFVGIEFDGESTDGVIRANRIGVDLAGNFHPVQQNGVLIDDDPAGASSILIGGTGPGDGNVITNAGAGGAFTGGIRVAATNDDIAVLGNSIVDNTGVGIDLGTDGVTPNDPGDGDVGANELLNSPALRSATVSAGTVRVVYDLDVPLNGDGYRIEFFSNPSGVDPSGYGEGEVLLGSADVAGPGTGYTFDYAGAIGDVVTATATEKSGAGFGATSEFSITATAVQADVILVDDRSQRRSDLAELGGLSVVSDGEAGRAGRAVRFDGVADRLSGPALDLTDGALGILVAFNADTNVGDPRLISKRTAAGTAIYEARLDSATGEAVGTLRVGGASVSVRGGTIVPGSWHTVQMSWDGAELVLHVDGVEVDRSPAVGPLATDVSTVAIVGGTDAGSSLFDGLIDDVRLSRAPITSAHVAATATTFGPNSLIRVGAEQTAEPQPWTTSTAQARSGTYALSAPETAGPGASAWAVARGVDEPGMVFESWWWFSTNSGVDLSSGTRAGIAPTDQYEGALSSPAGWELRSRSGTATSVDAAAAGGSVPGMWVEVELWTDQFGDSRLFIDGVEVTTWTSQGAALDSGSMGLRAGTLPPTESWYVDDARGRKLVTPEPVTSVSVLDRN